VFGDLSIAGACQKKAREKRGIPPISARRNDRGARLLDEASEARVHATALFLGNFEVLMI
jgi:hypothetical protein